MVQSFYSLQEAASVLGISEDELNQMAQSREVRAFADGRSWKFRQQDIEELARTRQHGSDPELQLSDSDSDSGTDDILDEDAHVMLDGIPEDDFGADDSAKTIIGVKGGGSASDSDVRLLLSENDAEDSDVRLVGDSTIGVGSDADAARDDSGVELGDDLAKAPSDSDIRMTFDDSVVNGGEKATDEPSQEFGERTEEITLREEDFDLSMSSEEGAAAPADNQESSDDDLDFNFDDDMSTGFKVEGTSDFDLAGFDSESDLSTEEAKSESDADDNDMTMPIESINLEDDSDIGLAPADSDISGGAVDSGINLNKPDDSGISLESSGELGSDSEFELSLDSDSETDIFGSDEIPSFKDDEDDEIRVEASDSSETDEVSDSDFELAIDEDFDDDDESGSEVVAIDEDEDDVEEALDADEDYDEEYDDYDDVAAAASDAPTLQRGAVGAAASNPPWPGWLAAPLSITTLLLVVCGVMMFEVMRNAWSHQTPYSLNGTLIQTVYDLAKSIGIAK